MSLEDSFQVAIPADDEFVVYSVTSPPSTLSLVFVFLALLPTPVALAPPLSIVNGEDERSGDGSRLAEFWGRNPGDETFRCH